MGVPVSEGVTKSFYFAFITTGLAAGLTYYILVRIWPQANYNINKGLSFREWSPDEVEVYAAGNDRAHAAGSGALPPLQRTESYDEKKMGDGITTNVLEA